MWLIGCFHFPFERLDFGLQGFVFRLLAGEIGAGEANPFSER